jgi:hypothetical protein
LKRHLLLSCKMKKWFFKKLECFPVLTKWKELQ